MLQCYCHQLVLHRWTLLSTQPWLCRICFWTVPRQRLHHYYSAIYCTIKFIGEELYSSLKKKEFYFWALSLHLPQRCTLSKIIESPKDRLEWFVESGVPFRRDIEQRRDWEEYCKLNNKIIFTIVNIFSILFGWACWSLYSFKKC